MAKVILKGYIIVPDSDLVAVQDELAMHIELTRQEEGCLVFEISQDKGTINKFNVYEEFTDRDSLTAHQDRVRNSKWGTVSAHVERCYQVTDAN